MECSPSKAGLVILWISAPSVLLFFFLTVYIPRLVRSLFKKTLRSLLLNIFGLAHVGGETGSQVVENAGKILRISAIIPSILAILLLLLVWFAVCTYISKRHFQYHLALTNSRVIGSSAGQMLNAPVQSIVNVFLEQPLLGKLLHYGTITVHTKKKSLSFYHIQNPEDIYNRLMQYAENYCANS